MTMLARQKNAHADTHAKKKQRLLEEQDQELKKSSESTTTVVNNNNDNNNDNSKQSSGGEKNKKKVHDHAATSSIAAATTSTTSSIPSCNGNNNNEEKKKKKNDTNTKNPSSSSAQSRTKNKKMRTKNLDPRIVHVRKIIQEGCRTNNLSLAMEAYQGAIHEEVRIEPQSYYNLLNLCDGLDRKDRRLHVGSSKLPPRTDSIIANATLTNSPDAAAAPPRSIDLQQRQEYIFLIKKRMQSPDINLPLNETAYTAIVKVLAKNHNFDKAEEILTEAESIPQCRPKLRLYASLLTAYCGAHEQQDTNNEQQQDTTTKCTSSQLIPALRVWKRLRQRASIMGNAGGGGDNSGSNGSGGSGTNCMELTEREYISLMKCALHTNNHLVMEDVLTRLAEDIPIPAKETVSLITKWFAQQNHNQVSSTTNIAATTTANDNTIVQQLLDDIRSYDTVSEPSPRMGPVVVVPVAQPQRQWMISPSCSIHTNGSGVLMDGCLKNYALKPVPLSDASFREMTQMNESIVVQGDIQNSNTNNKNKGSNSSIYQGGKKGKKRNRNDEFSKQKRQTKWNEFKQFLIQQQNNPTPSSTTTATSTITTTSTVSSSVLHNIRDRPYEVVIDGANIGYYKQNFGSGPNHVDYEQIDWVIRHFQQKLQKRVLLVMHQRHFAHAMLPFRFRPLVEQWRTEKILYATPYEMNDDWFWMQAALQYQCRVVTNDEMRDHHFQMLAPKYFLRWKERYQIHFDFGDWCHISTRSQPQQSSTTSDNGEGDGGGGVNSTTTTTNSSSYYQRRQGRERKVVFHFPNNYSRRIQRVSSVGPAGADEGLVIPLSKQGDENRFVDGYRSATGAQEPEEELYLCIRASSVVPVPVVVPGPQPDLSSVNQPTDPRSTTIKFPGGVHVQVKSETARATKKP